jgi:transcriptional regulator with GAF, ATPase, and Fis domain
MSKSSFHREASPLTGITSKAEDIQSALEELKKAQDDLAFIDKLNRIITSSLDISQVYESFAEELRQIIDVDWATIVLIEGDKLRFFALSTKIGSLWKQGEVIPLEGTATQWIAKTKQTLVEPDLFKERKFWTGEYHLRRGASPIHPSEARSKLVSNLFCHSEPHGRRISFRLFASLRVTFIGS